VSSRRFVSQNGASGAESPSSKCCRVHPTANPASIAFIDAHVLSSQVPRACHGLAAVTLDGAYAAFLSAVSFRRMSV
jgi:hypothetical protein